MAPDALRHPVVTGALATASVRITSASVKRNGMVQRVPKNVAKTIVPTTGNAATACVFAIPDLSVSIVRLLHAPMVALDMDLAAMDCASVMLIGLG